MHSILNERNLPGLLSYQWIACNVGYRNLRFPMLHFDAREFHLSAFIQAGIILPPSVAQSSAKRQAEYFFGRLAARLALSAVGSADLHVGTRPDRAPMWPSAIVGAISHSRARAAVCVGLVRDHNGIGIDIEGLLAPDAVTDVERVILSDEERMRLRNLAGLPYPLALTLAFSAKESVYKALYTHVGRFFGFDAVRIDSIDVDKGCLYFTTREHLSSVWTTGIVGRVSFVMLDETEVLTAFTW